MTSSRVICQERHNTDCREEEYLHTSQPNDCILNLAQMRSAVTLHTLCTPMRHHSLSHTALIDKVLVEHSDSLPSTPSPRLAQSHTATPRTPRTPRTPQVAHTPLVPLDYTTHTFAVQPSMMPPPAMPMPLSNVQVPQKRQHEPEELDLPHIYNFPSSYIPPLYIVHPSNPFTGYLWGFLAKIKLKNKLKRV